MLLSIAVLSYNRPQELVRCVESMVPLPQNVELLIIDDCSPRISQIRDALRGLQDRFERVHLIESEQNVGYDGNLLRAFTVSSARHVMLISDDDYAEQGCIASVLRHLKRNDVTTAFTRFGSKVIGSDRLSFERVYPASTYFPKELVVQKGVHIYNAILFSGLIFHRESVLENSELLKQYDRSIYTQVVMFIVLSLIGGSWFIEGPGVVAGGDGSSGFGLNQASVGELDLVDRSTPHSRLRYHKRLLFAIRRLAEQKGSQLQMVFEKEYNLRCVPNLLAARALGRKSASRYWAEYSSLGISTPVYLPLAFGIIWVMPYTVLAPLFGRSVRAFKYLRARF